MIMRTTFKGYQVVLVFLPGLNVRFFLHFSLPGWNFPLDLTIMIQNSNGFPFVGVRIVHSLRGKKSESQHGDARKKIIFKSYGVRRFMTRTKCFFYFVNMIITFIIIPSSITWLEHVSRHVISQLRNDVTL